MHCLPRSAATLLTLSIALAACGGGDSPQEPPLNTDYSALRVAESREGALIPANDPERVLHPLRNGLRLALNPGPAPAMIAGLTAPSADGQSAYSATTVQVEGVDEADLVKYDGQYIYIVRPEAVPPSPIAPVPAMTRNVLKIVRTIPAQATTETVSEFEIEGEQTTLPAIYQVQSAQGATQFLAAVSQNFQGWSLPQPQTTALVVQPDRTRVQLLDVRDPYNVSQAWSLELDGWLRGSRKIGNMLYLVNSYRPRLAGLDLPADTIEKRQANERRIRATNAHDLLPTYRVNGGAALPLASPGDCVVAADVANDEAYTDLVVITAIDLAGRRVADVACLSTNVNGVYVSEQSLYVGGEGRLAAENGEVLTYLHKFALDDGEIGYRANGVVRGRIGWVNASYFMDERNDDLRIVTTRSAPGLPEFHAHRLSVLHETANGGLVLRSILPNIVYPEPIGKPGEQVHAVRFTDDRAYIVTARITDPLYVIDLADPVDPFIAGELTIPGFATYLQPLGATGSELLLSVGQQTNAAGIRQGVKVELFDVSEIDAPRSLGVEIFGEAGSSSEAVGDPHALTFMTLSAQDSRLALPINVFATPHPTIPDQFLWSYSGVHLLEINDADSGTPQLRLQGVIRTSEPGDTTPWPPYVVPNRSVMHDEAVFVVHGESVIGSLWDSTAPN